MTETETYTGAVGASEILEAPRYSCAFAGAYAAAVATYGAVPILHSGAGCGIAQLFGQFYAGGQNAGGPTGGTSTPCSSLVEDHAIFGGEQKLRDLIASSIELMAGDLYVVVTGCVPSLIGDDVEAVAKEFRDRAPIVTVNTAGFKGTSYDGYEAYLLAVIDQLLEDRPTKRGRINVLGVVPYQHLFWKGELATIRETFAKVGVEANVVFTDFDGLERLKELPEAELTVVLSEWNGHRAAARLEERFGVPYVTFPSVPVGPKQTALLLREVATRLGLDEGRVEAVIKAEERSAYRFVEYLGDAYLLVRPHPYFSVIADSGAAIGLLRYLTDEMGYLPDLVQITDNPPEDRREAITGALVSHLATSVRPEVRFETDAWRIRQNQRGRTSLFLLASSLEKPIALEEFGTLPITVAFPSYDRMILDRSYAGFRGGLALMEEIISTYAGPL